MDNAIFTRAFKEAIRTPANVDATGAIDVEAVNDEMITQFAYDYDIEEYDQLFRQHVKKFVKKRA